MKINFETLNDNLVLQCHALEKCRQCLSLDEFRALLEGVRVIQKFNFDMMRLYECSEVELK
jgi:hypothetical protein